MEISNLIPHIEALIFASDKPLTTLEITDLINQAFGFMEDKISPEQIDAAIQGIVEKYSAEFYPFEVRQSGGGWQFLSKKEYHKTIAQLNGEKFLKRLSAAALETLAIIAYKQPITKGEIETIRGVSADYTIQKLLEKELIVITGRNEQLPGHPLVYATSKTFMDYFGINSPEDLPKIKEVLADQIIEPTIVNHTEFEEEISSMSVSGDGELIDPDQPEKGDAEHKDAQPTAEEATAGEGAATEETSGNTANAENATGEAEAVAPETNENAGAEELNEWREAIEQEENINTVSEDRPEEEADRKRDEENQSEDQDSEKESES